MFAHRSKWEKNVQIVIYTILVDIFNERLYSKIAIVFVRDGVIIFLRKKFVSTTPYCFCYEKCCQGKRCANFFLFSRQKS